MGDMVDWRGAIYGQLERRNAAEGAFLELIESHNLILRQNASLRARNEDLEKKVIILTHTNAEGSGGSVDTPENMKRLEERIRQLQEELTEKYRTDAQSANAQLSLTAEAQQFQRDLKAKTEDLEVCRSALSKLEAQADDLRQMAESKARESTFLREELVRTRERLESTEKSMVEVSAENQQLVERLVGEKLKVADEMNQMHSLMDGLKAKVKAKAPRFIAGSSSRTATLPPGAGRRKSTPSPSSTSGAAGGAGASTFAVPPQETRGRWKAHGAEGKTVAYSMDGQLVRLLK